ncbi:protein-glutamate O-methyltransferase CheR [Paucibacter sp. B2R-40]|uniref:CheR family methyltransferase n=1 Tax=Paucibacter sp. B2R-40 TaxID=2893554 RepID=UPI0021E4A47D|nr:CheR family methyltransferase [Paucibacter sp. B2R-40]MCV2356847.1 protein-glutamate O-methyltransferase CheR [Paucibacter sp. B2R-40]
MKPDQVEEVEVQLLLEGIFRVWGHDFRDYAPASLRRRLRLWLQDNAYTSISQAQGEVLREPELWDSLLRSLTVNVSAMFRDPQFFAALRSQVLPLLKTYAFSKIWVAGCASGEEAYSLAILLHEEGLSGRCQIYATDINEAVLQTARTGIYSLEKIRGFTAAYQSAGGRAAFSDYYTARYDNALMAPHLGENIVFAAHNLSTDGAFGEMHLVLCRNVMIYFNTTLSERVLTLFDDCLPAGCFLALGQKESLHLRSLKPRYKALQRDISLYQKLYV